jgi:hypothetical protein
VYEVPLSTSPNDVWFYHFSKLFDNFIKGPIDFRLVLFSPFFIFIIYPLIGRFYKKKFLPRGVKSLLANFAIFFGYITIIGSIGFVIFMLWALTHNPYPF